MKSLHLAITTLILAAVFEGVFVAAPCRAAAPEASASAAVYGKEDTASLKTLASAALEAAAAGKKPGAVTKITDLEKTWDRKEKVMKTKSPEIWTALDKALDEAIAAIRTKGDLAAGKAALENFIKQLDQATKP